jgi:hypothetical protein
MSGFIPRIADPQTRLDSLLLEKKIIAQVEAELLLPRRGRAKLPPARQRAIIEYRKDAESP